MSDNLLSYMRGVVARVTDPYRALPQTKAILSIGSVSYGVVDTYSDIDLALYYNELPSDEQLREAMLANGVSELKWKLGDRSSGGLIEAYLVDGIECQLAHSTLDTWHKYADTVLVDLDVKSPIQKMLSGILDGTPICGVEIVESLRERARNYPDALGKAMVEKHLSFQPIWVLEDRLSVRDATLWKQAAVVEGAQNLLAVLAGLNRLYFSTFQFKLARKFIDSMALKPDELYVRVETMLTDIRKGPGLLRDLVSETVRLIEAHMPEVDTTAVRALLGKVDSQWTLPPNVSTNLA